MPSLELKGRRLIGNEENDKKVWQTNNSVIHRNGGWISNFPELYLVAIWYRYGYTWVFYHLDWPLDLPFRANS